MSFGNNSPPPPPPPNPFNVASAQLAQDIQGQIAAAYMNNPNIQTPYGNLINWQSGERTISDANGNPITIPTFTQTQQLSPGQQHTLNQQETIGHNLNSLAYDQVLKLQDLLGSPIDPKMLPQLQQSIGGMPGFKQPVSTPNLATSFDKGPGVKYTFDTGPELKYGFDPGFDITRTFGQNRDPLLDSYAASDPLQTTFGDAGAIDKNYQRQIGADDFSEDRRRVEEALFSRLQPQYELDKNALENKLVNQGLVRGTEAFNQQMDEINRQMTDARYQAVLAGGQEQSRLFGMDATKGQFANQATSLVNQAQQQEYQQMMQRGEFANAAKLAQEQLNAARATFTNNARMAGFSQEAAIAAFENSAQAQQFSQNQALAQFFNAAAGQEFGQNLGAAQFYNQAQGQNFGQNQALAQFGNQALQQNYINKQGATDTANSLAQQGFQNQVTGANFSNNAALQEFQRQLALRNQPINEITSLMSGSQVNMPQFPGFQGSPAQQSIIGQSIFNSAQMANNQWQTQQQQQAQQNAGLFGLGAAALGGLAGGPLGAAGMGALSGLFKQSDRRLKRDIERVGEHKGIPVYTFRYLTDDQVHVGVMADDVEKVMPDAVVDLGPFRAVNYAMVI